MEFEQTPLAVESNESPGLNIDRFEIPFSISY